MDEIFEKKNEYFCGNCNKHCSKAIKKNLICSLPNHLIITLNRFAFNSTLKKRIKVFHNVHLPSVMEIPSKFLLESFGREQIEDSLINYENQSSVEIENDLTSEESNRLKENSKSLYKLYAIIVHSVKP